MSRLRALLRFLTLSVIILGGLHGLVITFPLVFSENVRGVVTFVLWGCMLAGYSYVTIAALIFWLRPNRFRPLFWAQVIQVPWISLPGIVYKFAVGFSGAVAFIFSHTGEKYEAGYEAHFRLGSSCKLSFLENAPLELGLNLGALGVLYLLREIHRGSNKPLMPLPPSIGEQNCVPMASESLGVRRD